VLTLDEFEARLCRAGRVKGPRLLFEAWFGREIDRDVLAVCIGAVWSGAEYPFGAMTQSIWRELFDAAGYTVDGKPAKRPVGPTRLYRGSIPTLRRRWSWTTDRALAERFARGYVDGGFLGRMPGKVYVLDVPPESLLCAINDRRESEYVVDTRGLKIREVP
jgi:hypothetical protein